MEAINDAIEAIVKHLSDRIVLAAFGVFAILGLILLLSHPTWLQPYRLLVLVGFLFCLFYPLTRLAVDRYAGWEQTRKVKAAEKVLHQKVANRLQNLSRPEKELLRLYMREETSARQLHIEQWPVAIGLERDGIMYVSSDQLSAVAFYSIEPTPYQMLRRNPHLLI